MKKYRTSEDLIGVEDIDQRVSSKEFLTKQLEALDDKIIATEKQFVELKNKRKELLKIQRGDCDN
ncbi:MAG: hypothetical protein COS89_07755 [Deltaproteobacteria bacterium CG07_land_8_20_14_0_80_38_7]|nr:MAG: hypothetical protein COS89_07755 [Deltaproteobacteria bacterium CG07_land_8_20_14_0_80_38_7]